MSNEGVLDTFVSTRGSLPKIWDGAAPSELSEERLKAGQDETTISCMDIIRWDGILGI